MDGRGNMYTPPGGTNQGRTRSSSYPTPSEGNEHRTSSRSRGASPIDNPSYIPQGENTRTLGQSSSLAPSTRFKHYASLLLAEKPVEAHREFQRKVRTGGLHTDTPGPVDGDDMMDTMNAGRPEMSDQQGARSSSRNGRSGTNASLSPFTHDEFGGGRNSERGGRGGGPPRPSETGHGGADEEDLDADAADPEYEAYRKAFKQGYMYRVVKGEIVKNKRRRGRAGYLATLKSVYSSIVPSGGRRQPLKLSGMAQAKAYAYIFAMVIFDRVTPTLLGLNASLIVLFIMSAMVLMSMFAAGQSRAWREAIFAAEDQTLPSVEGQKNWGPSRLWNFFVKDNNKFGHGVYMTEWGGVGAVIIHVTGESFRYITAVFIHDSVWHLLLVGGSCAVAGVLVERRYGIFRTLVMTSMLLISSSMGAVLFNDKCSVSFGSSPLAWGYLMWWIVDTASRITLWPLRDRERLWKMVTAYKNWSNIVLLISTTLTLFISETSLGTSSAPPSIVAAVSALLITPVMAPRWSTSALEAATVPVAIVAVIIFWVIIPIAGAGTVSGVTDAEVNTCGLIQLEPVA